jgi:hypothetical protein
MSGDLLPALRPVRVHWNKGRIIGQKHPLMPRHVWSIRVRLEMAGNARDLALFNMAVDSKLRGCDLVGLRVRDVFAAGRVKERTSMIQSKTGKPVRFEITETTRVSLDRWIGDPEMNGLEFLWPSRIHGSPHLSTRQYARIDRGWVTSVGLEPSACGTHSMPTDQGRADLQEDWQPACGPAAAGAYEDGQHGALPRCRHRGRFVTLGGDRPLRQTRAVRAGRARRQRCHWP